MSAGSLGATKREVTRDIELNRSHSKDFADYAYKRTNSRGEHTYTCKCSYICLYISYTYIIHHVHIHIHSIL